MPSAPNRNPTFYTGSKLLTRRGVLWLGQTCNIRCHFCYFLDRIADKEHPEHAFMDIQKAKQICRDLRGVYGNTSVDIQGGEPTIWRHIDELVAYCAEIQLRPTIITNAIALAKKQNLERIKAAGVQDLLISVQGLGAVYDEIVGLRGGSAKQMAALDNCVEVGVPFRFNCVLSKNALPQYSDIARLAVEKGARVVNFLAFNPFEDQAKGGKRSIENVARYSEVAESLNTALDILDAAGIEANVRYFPICVIAPRHRKSIYNFQQLSYDAHEWDFDSWTWTGRQPQRMKWGPPSRHHLSLAHETYGRSTAPGHLQQSGELGVKGGAAERSAAATAVSTAYLKVRRGISRIAAQMASTSMELPDELGRSAQVYRDHARLRAAVHCRYQYAPSCDGCDAKRICDGFHGDYAAMFGVSEAAPIALGQRIDDPTHFVRGQRKILEVQEAERPWPDQRIRAA